MVLPIFLPHSSRSAIKKQGSFYAYTLAEKCGQWPHPSTTRDCREFLIKADNVIQDSTGKA